jgi:hypothetical protein
MRLLLAKVTVVFAGCVLALWVWAALNGVVLR